MIRLIVGLALLFFASGVPDNVSIWVMIVMGASGVGLITWAYTGLYKGGTFDDYQ